VVVDGAGRAAEITYDAENQRTRIERAGIAQEWEHDPNALIVERTDPNGHTATPPGASRGSSTLSGERRPTATTTRAASAPSTNYAYDAAGRLTSYERVGAPSIEHAYDGTN